MTRQLIGCLSPPQSPSVDTQGLLRDQMRLRTEWQRSVQHNGQRMDLSTPPHSPSHKRLKVSQLPLERHIPMDTQRLLSVLKVMHTELTALTERIRNLEEKVVELKSSMEIEFELESESDESGEESEGDSDESGVSVQSAPSSFQY